MFRIHRCQYFADRGNRVLTSKKYHTTSPTSSIPPTTASSVYRSTKTTIYLVNSSQFIRAVEQRVRSTFSMSPLLRRFFIKTLSSLKNFTNEHLLGQQHNATGSLSSISYFYVMSYPKESVLQFK